MGVVMAGIAPHPPLLIPEVGGGHVKWVEKTQKAMDELGKRVKQSGAEALVVISPHAPIHRDAVAVLTGDDLRGNFSQFGAPHVKLEMRADLELWRELKEEAGKAGMQVTGLEHGILDHGVTVPLYYLQRQGVELPGLVMAFSLEPALRLYRFGQVLQKAMQNRGRKIAVIASGDLSHRLTRQAPAGYDPRGEEFDRTLVKLLQEYRVNEILNMEDVLLDRAGECGYRSILIMLGCLSGYRVQQEVLSYEGPFGVGYTVASFTPLHKEEENDGSDSSSVSGINKQENYPDEGELAGLARRSLEFYLHHGKQMPLPEDISPFLKEEKRGAFVTLKKGGQLRGCIGTIKPTCENLAREIAVNAVKAGLEDPRFYPVKEHELPDLEISVDVLSPMEPVEDLSRLDPSRYGILVTSGNRSGLLLPALEGISTVEQQLNVAMQKGGISPGEPYRLYRFMVERYGEGGGGDE